MDERVNAAAQGALRRLNAGLSAIAVAGQASKEALRLDRLTLAQLSSLAYLQAEEPVVQQVLDALRSGRPVYLDRPSVEKALVLSSFPPRIQEQFARWFSRIAGYGIQLTGETQPLSSSAAAPAPSKAATAGPGHAQPVLPPERQVLADILGETCPAESPCVLEPKKSCCGSGRCKSLGF